MDSPPIPLTGTPAPPLAPGGTDPTGVKADKLDAPLRTRVISTGPQQITPVEPFSGLSFVDILNVRAAMADRLSNLSQDPASSQHDIESTKRVMKLAHQKLSPQQPQEGLVVLPAIKLPQSARDQALAGGS